MHIFFSGIGGAGIGPLALVAKQAGYEVSGSDKQNSSYLEYLNKKGIKNIAVGQSADFISKVHARKPIDWYVYSSAVEKENPDAPEFKFVDENDIKRTKRDEFLSNFLKEKNLKMIAIAGTHGKTTTTAMTVWLFKQLGIPVSYILPAKTNFAEMGQFDSKSEYFIYEADEFDRNFLAYHPRISLITGISWDHHEIFTTARDYQKAFEQFIGQSQLSVMWFSDFDWLKLKPSDKIKIIEVGDFAIDEIDLVGEVNRWDAWMVVNAVHQLLGVPIKKMLPIMSDFPGLQRRMEQIVPNLYSDYAHTPEKIRGALTVATEIAHANKQKLIVVYEGLTNRRQHYFLDNYKNCFAGADKIYWIPSYLAREDPNQKVLKPAELIAHLDNPTIAEPIDAMDENLKKIIQSHLDKNDMVVCMTGGGGGSLDEWLRLEFRN